MSQSKKEEINMDLKKELEKSEPSLQYLLNALSIKDIEIEALEKELKKQKEKKNERGIKLLKEVIDIKKAEYEGINNFYVVEKNKKLKSMNKNNNKSW